jgi:hypothetical protein
MTLPVDPGNAIPTSIQEFDGFDTATIDTTRWETPTIIGSTGVSQTGGKLQFLNEGTGTLGTSSLISKQKFGKQWRISTKIKIASSTGILATAALSLYKDANNQISIGPVKTAAINCNCYVGYTVNGITVNEALTTDIVDNTNEHEYTIAITETDVLVYYDKILLKAIPFPTLNDYTIRLRAGTGNKTDTITATFDNYDMVNKIDTQITDIKAQLDTIDHAIDTLLGMGVDLSPITDKLDDIEDKIDVVNAKVGTSIVTDISGTLVIDDTTYHYMIFNKATYGKKFRVNIFADLEGQDIDHCLLYKSTGPVWTDQTAVANSMQSNTVLLKPVSDGAVGDIIYFGNDNIFKRLDIYMAQGASNTNNVYAWEGWTGAAWVSLTKTDGTLYGGMVFGTSGKVTFTDTLVKTTVNGVNAFWIRARITTLGAAQPVATHIQVSEDIATGFDGRAEFLSSMVVSIFRKRADGNYGTLPTEMGLPYTQCILYRNLGITDLPCWSDTMVGFKLSATPTAAISIPYNGYIETIETNT